MGYGGCVIKWILLLFSYHFVHLTYGSTTKFFLQLSVTNDCIPKLLFWKVYCKNILNHPLTSKYLFGYNLKCLLQSPPPHFSLQGDEALRFVLLFFLWSLFNFILNRKRRMLKKCFNIVPLLISKLGIIFNAHLQVVERMVTYFLLINLLSFVMERERENSLCNTL